jgi:hypothetical protein
VNRGQISMSSSVFLGFRKASALTPGLVGRWLRKIDGPAVLLVSVLLALVALRLAWGVFRLHIGAP